MRFPRYVIAVIGMFALCSWSATAIAQQGSRSHRGGGEQARSGDRGGGSRAQSQRSGQARSSRGSSQQSAQAQRSGQSRGQGQSRSQGRTPQAQSQRSGERSSQAQSQRRSQGRTPQVQSQRSGRDSQQAQGDRGGQARGSRDGQTVPRVVTQGRDQRSEGQRSWQSYRDSRDGAARSGDRDRGQAHDQRDRGAQPRDSGRGWQYADRDRSRDRAGEDSRQRDWNRGRDSHGDADRHGDRYADYWRGDRNRDRDYDRGHDHRSRYGYGYNRFVVGLVVGRPYGGGGYYSYGYNRGLYSGYPYYGGSYYGGAYYGTRYTTGYAVTEYATEELVAQPAASGETVIPTNEAAAPYQEAAEIAFRAGRYEEALRHSSHAMLEDGENGYMHLFLSQTLFALGDYEGAAVTLDQGLSLLEPESWGYVVSNYVEFYTGDEYVQQMNALVTFLEENPQASYAYLVRGYHYLYLGELAGARAQLERAVELEPRDPYAVEMLVIAGGQAPAAAAPGAETAPVLPAP